MAAAERYTIEGLLAVDTRREVALRRGSDKLLRSLWREHPKKMREYFTCYMAETPQQVKAVVEMVKRDVEPPQFPAVVRQPETGKRLLHCVAKEFGISYGELIGEGRSTRFIHARAVVIAVLSKRGWSYSRIGQILGGRDHSTVIHSADKWDIYCKINPLLNHLLAKYQPEWG